MTLEPIFPYFGGKRRAASQVWQALGKVDRYIEPFFGSGAVLLGNPHPAKSELVNDLNHHVANLWRALQHDPEEVWRLATAPCSEVELKARASWLREWKPYDFGDVDAYDAKAAGFWLWQSCVAIAGGNGLHASDYGNGIKGAEFTKEWFNFVVNRLARIQIKCGDWSKCVTPTILQLSIIANRSTGIFLDPPYGIGSNPYEDGTGTVARDVWEWALANGDNPKLRIVVAGYEDGRELPEGWVAIFRTEKGGYGARKTKNNDNHKLERLWCSPHCLNGDSNSLFF